MTFKQILITIVSSLLVAGCGGGGGGGGSASDSTGVRFIHASLDGSPRQATVDGVSVSDYVNFGKASPFKKVGSGVKAITLLGRAGDIETTQPVEITGNNRVDAVLLESPADNFQALAFTHPAAPAGRAVRLINAARSSEGVATASLNGTAVTFGSGSEYQAVTNSATVSIAGSAQSITLPVEGRLFTLVALGEAGYLTRTIVLIDE